MCCAGSAKSGLGSAYRAGFRWGLERGYEACVEMDADFSHDPAALPGLLAPLSDGYEVVDRLPLRRRAARSPTGRGTGTCCRGAATSTRRSCSDSAVADSTAGFRAYAASVLRRIDLDEVRAEGYGFQIEMTYRAKQAGAAITEVPIRFVDRVAGESKMSSAIVVEALGLVTLWGWAGAGRALASAGGPLTSGPRSPAATGG